MSVYRRITLATALILLSAAHGCADRPTEYATRKAFDGIAGEAVGLYVSMHPLRASRLGVAGADSMLFTFSQKEIERAVSVIDTLLDALSSLPADDLDERRIDESVLLDDWMKGERFVFTQSRTCLDNPLLYCWMIEEAIFDVPLRPWPPEPGEREAWSSRLRRIPILVENASALLRKPDRTRLELSSTRLEKISDRLPGLLLAAGERFGGKVEGLEVAAAAVATYRSVVDSIMAASTRGRIILGMEELSRMLRYSEHLDLDPERMTAEAEKIARRLSRQLPSMAGGAGVQRDDPTVIVSIRLADSILTDIEERKDARRTFGQSKSPRSPVKAFHGDWRPERIPVNPYLTPPSMPQRETRWSFDPEGRRVCLPSVFIQEGRELRADEFLFDMLLSSSLISSPGRMVCGAESPVALIFGGETFYYAWSAFNISDLTGLYPEERMGLALIDTKERLIALARMIVVFRLHSGKYTTESAQSYFSEVTPLTVEEIEAEVTRALISPASAFEGIAIMTVDSMIKKATSTEGSRKPRSAVRSILIESSGMPPYLLMERMQP